jgi:hypothetical protein
VSYILDLMRGTIESHPDRISLERYVQESSYVTRYLSRVVKDKALVVYHVLFHLSWFETGKGEIVVPWARVGSFIRSEQGNIIDNLTTVKRRLPDRTFSRISASLSIDNAVVPTKSLSICRATDLRAVSSSIEKSARPLQT